MLKNHFLIACLVLYAVLTGLLIARVPINGAPDEMAHLEYVEFMAQEKTFPLFEPKGANEPGYEFHQPPLYYSLAAPFFLVSKSTLPYFARGLSLLCGGLSLIFLWSSLRLLFPDDRVLAPLATGFAALWPMHIAVSASAGNDALTGTLCAGMFWSVARLAQRAAQEENQQPKYLWRDAALVGVFFGLGMLAKSSALVIGIAAVGAVFHLIQRRQSTSAAFSATAVTVGVTLLLCGWWLMRNTSLYGDPLAAQIFDEAFAKSSPRPQALMAATGVSVFQYLRAFFTVLFATCWGFFGGPNTAITMLNPFGNRGPRFEAFTALPLMLFPLLATALAAVGFLKWKWRSWKTSVLASDTQVALLWWGAGFLLMILALARFNFIQFQAQARYLHPVLLPMCLVFALGWREVLGENRALRAFAIGFGAVLLLLTLWNIVGWQTLI